MTRSTYKLVREMFAQVEAQRMATMRREIVVLQLMLELLTAPSGA